MTEQQALQIVNNATAELSLKRKDHLLLLQAIQVLQKAISPEKATQEVPDLKVTPNNA